MQQPTIRFLEVGDHLFIKRAGRLVDFTVVNQVNETTAILDNGDSVKNPFSDGSHALDTHCQVREDLYYFQTTELAEQFDKIQLRRERLSFGLVCFGVVATSVITALSLSSSVTGLSAITYYSKPYVKLSQPCESYLEEFQKTPFVEQGKKYLQDSLTCLDILSYPKQANEYRRLQNSLAALGNLSSEEITPSTIYETVRANTRNLDIDQASKSSEPFLERYFNPRSVSLFLLSFPIISIIALSILIPNND